LQNIGLVLSRNERDERSKRAGGVAWEDSSRKAAKNGLVNMHYLVFNDRKVMMVIFHGVLEQENKRGPLDTIEFESISGNGVKVWEVFTHPLAVGKAKKELPPGKKFG
jgi:hypothetical protein